RKKEAPPSSLSHSWSGKKVAKNKYNNTSVIDLGCPKELNFSGSTTMEQGLYAGSSTINGTSSGYTTTQADLSQWTHVAATYDTNDMIWRIYVNGGLVTNNSYPSNPNCMPQANGKNWFIGSISGRPFFGQVCDIRIWSCTRTEEQIKKNMKARVEDVLAQENLRGFWPCNDGLGLVVRDLSPFNNYGFIKDCEWKNEPRPFPLRISKDETETLQGFSPSVTQTATFYTNGETLVIAHPSYLFWNRTYYGVAQKFSLDTGLLLDELEYEDFGNVESACFSSNGKHMWLLAGSVATSSSTCHTMQAPTTISQWRASRMQQLIEEAQQMTPKKLLKKYALPGVDALSVRSEKENTINLATIEETLDALQNTSASASVSASASASAIFNNLISSGISSTPSGTVLRDEVSATLALANIIVKLDNDCEALRTVDTLEHVPMSLSIPFGVDLTTQTFESLLEIAERLTEEFYATEWTEPKEVTPSKKDLVSEDFSRDNLEEVRMLALLTVLRALRTNITHLVTWNVDPTSCGFNKRQTDDLGLELEESLTIRERYVKLLNRLVFDRPSRTRPKLLEDEVHTEVAECLSIGLSVFYMDPIDRVGILFDHVEGCTTSPNPLRLLLASRYFDSLTKPHNLIGLVPALITIYKKGKDSPMFPRCFLLHSVLQLIFDDAKLAMKKQLEDDTIITTNNNNNNNTPGQDLSSALSKSSGKDLIRTLRQFLARMEICLFNGEMGKNEKDVYTKYALPYAFKLIDNCSELIESVNNKKVKLELHVQASLLKIFEERVGELLPPLINVMWGMTIDPKLASDILPRIHRLLVALNTLMQDLPNILVSERDFVVGKYDRIVVDRTVVAESIHPVQRGTSEKTVSVPGAKVLKLTIDPQTFNSNAPGASLTLYRRPNQQDPIEGANFVTTPNKPLFVSGDTVTIGYNSVSVSATTEEVRYELPWVLDLAKSCALLASKCTGVYIAAPAPNDLDLDRSTLDWLQNDLLSQGIEYDDKADAKERAVLSYLPFDLSPVLKRYHAINYLQIAKDLAPLLARIPYQKFPLPSTEVAVYVDNAVLHVFAVLLKHNLLTKTALKMLSDHSHAIATSTKVAIPDSVQRVWKTAQKLRGWLVQKFQAELSAKQAELTRKIQENDDDEEVNKGEGKASARKIRRKMRRVRGASSSQSAMPVGAGHNDAEHKTELEEKKEEQTTPGHVTGIQGRQTGAPNAKEVHQDENEDEDEDEEAKLLRKKLEEKKKQATGIDDHDEHNKKKKGEQDTTKDRSKEEKDKQGKEEEEEKKIVYNNNNNNNNNNKKQGDIDEKNSGITDDNIVVDKVKLYQDICKVIETRCAFLLKVLAVQPEVLDDLPMPSLMRNKSSDAPTEKTLQTATATLMAWHSTKEGVELKSASMEQRYLIVWKLVLKFLDTDKIETDKLIAKMEMDRIRARMRAFGLRVLRIFREILHFLIPSLQKTHAFCFVGEAPSIFGGLAPIGYGLTDDLLDATNYLYSLLIQYLKEPMKSGSHLIQATLYAFALDSSRREFELMNRLGIFDALKILLNHQTESSQTSESTSSSSSSKDAVVKGDDDAKNAAIQGAYQTSAWSLLEMLASTIMSIRQSQTSSQQKADIRMDSYLEKIYSMVLEQLDKISQVAPAEPGPWMPQLPPTHELKFGGAKAKEKEDSLISRKVATVSRFGIASGVGVGLAEDGVDDEEPQTDILGGGGGIGIGVGVGIGIGTGAGAGIGTGIGIGISSTEQGATTEESFHVRVLNLVEELCETHWNVSTQDDVDDNDNDNEKKSKGESSTSLELLGTTYSALDLFSQKRSLSALLRLLWNGSPRTRVVTLRILRHVLSSRAAPSWQFLDECDNCKRKDINQSMFIHRLLKDIGCSLCAPVVACYFDGKHDASMVPAKHQQLWDYFVALKLPLLHSTDFVSICAEEIMTLRYLVRKSPQSWQPIIGSSIERALAYLSKHGSKTADIGDELFECIGALALLGGYVDNIRVGSRVYYSPEDLVGVVTSRSIAKSRLTLIREVEGSAIDKVAMQEVVALGDEVFDVSIFGKSIQWSNVMQNLVHVLKQKLNLADTLEHIKDKIDLWDMVNFKIQSLCAQTLNGVLLNTDMLQLFVRLFQSNAAKILTDIAFTRTHESCEVPTGVLCDRSHILMNECFKRSRKYERIEVSVEHTTSLSVKVKKPTLEFFAEFSCLGKHLEKQHQGVTGLSESTKGTVKGLLSYIQLNEEPTLDKCQGKIVMIDTYEKQKDEKSSHHHRRRGTRIAKCKHGFEPMAMPAPAFNNNSNWSWGSTNPNFHGFGGMGFGQSQAVPAMRGRGVIMPEGGTGFGVSDDISEMAHGTSLDLVSSKKKDEKTEKSDADDIDAVKGLLVVAVPQNAGETMRMLLGVKEVSHPKALNRQMMIQELIVVKGHERGLAERALKKEGNTTVEAADAWIRANREWLVQTIEAEDEKEKGRKVKEKERSKTVSADQLKMVSLEELEDDQLFSANKWKLAEKWKDFQDATLRNLTTGSSSQPVSSSAFASFPSYDFSWGGGGGGGGGGSMPSGISDYHTHVEEYDHSAEPNAATKEWYNRVAYQTTHDLLFHVIVTEHALRVHVMRRTLLSLFTQISLHNIVTPKEFEQILHICLALRPHPAAELDPVNSMKATDITGRLVRCLRDEQTNSSSSSSTGGIGGNAISNIGSGLSSSISSSFGGGFGMGAIGGMG
ncbi:vcbs repeat containing protein, partial [Reticulomyxa filosa]